MHVNFLLTFFFHTNIPIVDKEVGGTSLAIAGKRADTLEKRCCPATEKLAGAVRISR
jgi:hypothetical protein